MEQMGHRSRVCNPPQQHGVLITAVLLGEPEATHQELGPSAEHSSARAAATKRALPTGCFKSRAPGGEVNPAAWQPLSFTAWYIPSQAISGIQGERSCSRKEQGAGWAAEESEAGAGLRTTACLWV